MLNEINHTTLEALLFRHSIRNGKDVFINGNIRVMFDGDKPVMSVDDRLVEVEDIEELKRLLLSYKR